MYRLTGRRKPSGVMVLSSWSLVTMCPATFDASMYMFLLRCRRTPPSIVVLRCTLPSECPCSKC
ncbi:hypothetical protein BDR04DRAFT_237014 [Suillus decipiens]|nr:hypothetical protein BDR04DRAFT_237014 [Suillus decipiens]